MDAPTLENALNNLDLSWKSLDSWLTFWVALVVIGVAVELVVVVIEYLHGRQEFRRGTIRSPDRPSIWLFSSELLGAGLVAIGVAGELAVHFKSTRVETAMRITSQQLVSLAGERAAKAEERASGAELENTKLRAAMADRSLSAEQQRAIHEACKRFAGKLVYIRSYPDDMEAKLLAVEIKAALEPYVRVEDRTGELLESSLVLGIRVLPEEHERPFGQALVDILRHKGQLSVQDLSPFGGGTSPTELQVGIKPLVLARQTAAIQQKMVDRRLTPEQQRRVAESLCKASRGGINVELDLYNPDGESRVLGQDIERALPRTCGFVVSISPKLATMGFSGIQVVLRKDDTNPNHKTFADALVTALRREGLQTEGPIPPPRRGAEIAGGTDFKRETTDSAGAGIAMGETNGLTVEIAIGKKP